METNPYLIAGVGLVAGVFAGLLGIGGAIIIVPILVFVFGLTQQQAQGTTTAFLVLPVGLLGAWVYYQRGLVNVKWSLLLAAGFFLGSFAGARLAISLSNDILQKLFGILLIAVGVRMTFFGR
ncbi:MAG: sulfite exporter TauE/SafE family protein [Bacteroidetes bacterium]|jgi:hypothetical protein|nr:sulfite exporter TauE/SafE family protein [Bacteroidota bacterium]